MSHQISNAAETQRPAGSLWPLVLAAGITLLLFGILTSIAFSAAGLALSGAGIAGWIVELHHETRR